MYRYHAEMPDRINNSPRVVCRDSDKYFTHVIVAKLDTERAVAMQRSFDELLPFRFGMLMDDDDYTAINDMGEEELEERRREIRGWVEAGINRHWFCVYWTGSSDTEGILSRHKGKPHLQEVRLVELDRQWIGDGPEPPRPEPKEKFEDMDIWERADIKRDARGLPTLVPLILADYPDGIGFEKIKIELSQRFRRNMNPHKITQKLQKMRADGILGFEDGIWWLVPEGDRPAKRRRVPLAEREEAPLNPVHDTRWIGEIIAEMLQPGPHTTQEVYDRLREEHGIAMARTTLSSVLSRLPFTGTEYGRWYLKRNVPVVREAKKPVKRKQQRRRKQPAAPRIQLSAPPEGMELPTVVTTTVQKQWAKKGIHLELTVKRTADEIIADMRRKRDVREQENKAPYPRMDGADLI